MQSCVTVPRSNVDIWLPPSMLVNEVCEWLTFKSHRQDINDGKNVARKMGNQKLSVYQEFPEFTRKQIKNYEGQFLLLLLCNHV